MGLFGLNFGGGGTKTTQNQNTSVDTNTRNQLGSIFNAYQGAGAAGPSPLLTGAGNFATGAQNAGNLGLGALSGNPAQMAQLMSPYMQQVMAANNAQLAKTDAVGTNQINSNATQAGAFGGSRQGVAEGTMLSANALNNNQLNANMLNSGYQNAQGVAQGLAGVGMQGAQLGSNLGFGGVGSPAQWYAQMLRQGFIQPTGSTSGQTQTTTGGNFGFHIG